MLSTCGVISPLEFFGTPNPPYKKPRAQQWDAACPVMDPIRQIKKAGGSQFAAGESQVPSKGMETCSGAQGTKEGIPSTHHRHHHRLLCHPPVGDHGPLGPAVGKGYWIRWSQSAALICHLLLCRAQPPWGCPCAQGSPVTPQIPLSRLSSCFHAPLAEFVAQHTSYTWPGPGGPSQLDPSCPQPPVV